MQGASISIHSLVAVGLGFLVIICIFPKVKKAGYHFMHVMHAMSLLHGFGKSCTYIHPLNVGLPNQDLD